MDEEDVCVECGAELPPLNGVEENDFAYLCDECLIYEEEAE